MPQTFIPVKVEDSLSAGGQVGMLLFGENRNPNKEDRFRLVIVKPSNAAALVILNGVFIYTNSIAFSNNI